MRLSLLFLVFFVSCGDSLSDSEIKKHFTPMTDPLTRDYHEFASSYLYSWLHVDETKLASVRYWRGDDEDFHAVGLYPEVSEATIIDNDIFIDEKLLFEAPLCYVIAHELGHYASKIKFGDYDEDHCRLGNSKCEYDFMQAACLRLGVK